MKRTKLWWTLRFLGSFWLCLVPLLGSRAVGAAVPGKEEVRRALDVMPRGFVPNQGQWDERAAYAAMGFYGTTWVTRGGELRHVLLSRGACEEKRDRGVGRFEGDRGERRPCRARASVLSERFVGGKVRGLRGREELGGRVSFFIGNDPRKHRSGLSTYRYLELGEVVPGVRVTLAAGQKTVEKVFEVLPGADPKRIWVELVGAEGVAVAETGELVVRTGFGEVVFSAPKAWQEEGGKRREVAVAYEVRGKRYGFRLGAYDPAVTLWIDPILQSTYLGGSDLDYVDVHDLAFNPDGTVYAYGVTRSSNFPVTPGGFDTTSNSPDDVFVVRLRADLQTILQATYFGGTGDDEPASIEFSPFNNQVYIAGDTGSDDIPNTAGGAQSSRNPFWGDLFIARLDATLSTNPQSTYWGGNGIEDYGDLAIQPGTGHVYVVSMTESSNLANTAGAAQSTYAGGRDAFVAYFNADLTTNFRTTYLGGSGYEDFFPAIRFHPGNGDLYVLVPITTSDNFPGTSGGAQSSRGGDYDAVVARLSPDLTTLVRATYLGGPSRDYGRDLAIHPTSGDLYVVGTTEGSFPYATGAQTTFGGGTDAFVVYLRNDLTQVLGGTYLGGAFGDEGWAVEVSPTSGEVYVAGATASSTFPATSGGAQPTIGGGTDGFVTRLNPSLSSFLQSTFLGGSLQDIVYSLRLHPTSGEVYVAGSTRSSNFPQTAGGAQPNYGGVIDGFVSRLTADLAGSQSADMEVSAYSISCALSPGGSISPNLLCSNNGPGAAINATCGLSASAGTVTANCSPPVPVASLPSGNGITCTFVYQAPGTLGGGDTPETVVTFTFATGADNDANTSNNTVSPSNCALIVDALDDAASYPAGTAGASYNVGANDQYGTGSLPGTASFTLLPATTCTGATINAGGVATFNVPASGTCVVAYQVCVSGACDNAQLLVTPTYTITVSVNPSGAGSVTCSPNPVPHGSGSTCTINANPGYSLQSVTGCGGTLSGSTYTIPPLTGACTVNVTFQQQQAQAIPTLDEWGLLTLITLLAASGVLLLRRLWA